jgi:hypothetical protein
LDLKGDFYNYSGSFYMTGGTTRFIGSVAQNISDTGTGCYFNNLITNPSSSVHVYINSSLQVHGKVRIEAGYLEVSSNYTITVGGNWENTGAIFYEGSSRVVFNGTADQTIYGEAFNILE